MGAHPPPGERLESLRGRHLRVGLSRGTDDRTGEGVLRVGFDGGGQAQDVHALDPESRDDVRDRRAPAREGPGLVEDDEVQIPCAFEREPVLDQQPVAGSQ
jgi:hypothetical protein